MENKKYKVIFMGTPDFACPTLERLYYDEDIDLCLVVTKEDKPAGRGKEMQESAVKKLAKKLGVPVCHEWEFLTPQTSHCDVCKENTSDVCLEGRASTSDVCLEGADSTSDVCKENTSDVCKGSASDVCKESTGDVCKECTSDEISQDNPRPHFCSPFSPDFIVVVAYGKILPKAVLQMPKYGCINGHASLLPKYRGASPVQNCIKNGENETGVTTMLMEEGLDTGDILKVKKIKIEDTDTGGSLFGKLSNLTADCVIETIKDFENITPTKQDDNKATYVKTITKDDGQIEPDKEKVDLVLRKIRAYDPWPGTHVICNASRIKIIRAKRIDNELITENLSKIQKCEKLPIFCTLDRTLLLRVLDGFLEIQELQMEGRKKMLANDFINGLK